jgi:aldehyde dehydrogenase
VLFALNSGEICTCPSRFLVHEDIYDRFIEKVIARTKAIKVGHPLDPTVMMGSQVSDPQYKKILNYIDIGVAEGATVLTGGKAHAIEGGVEGFYIEVKNSLRVFVCGCV